ncbi:putative 1-acylglycerol-3-phosphate O-acyltransferase [Ananas comosus]|uniref:Putative 1-acylglycerol-3-phosphate O-acyltransferase n=1 Tax=Ananas comosus TaxID=4615 RepID=A0A199V111_ANACO|nr:putative 1-acylglycerol-3-phosphate O-acyltransferase [Ananas comosus]
MSRAASARMAEEIGRVAAAAETSSSSAASLPSSSRWAWPSVLRWIPTSTDRIIAAEKRLLSLVKTRYVQEQVNIGSGPPGSKVRWFRSTSDQPRFINTVTFDSKESSPTLVMVHGYGASQGFFFRNFDALASRFRVIAIDQLGWVDLVDLTSLVKVQKAVLYYGYSSVNVKLKHGSSILSRNGARLKTLVTLFCSVILLEDMLQLSML